MRKPKSVCWLAILVFTWSYSAEVGETAGLGRKAPVYTPSGQWEAYFMSKKGIPGPVLLPPERNKDTDWMLLQFTDYSGPKIRVAVHRVENRTASTQAGDTEETVVVVDPAAEVNVASIETMLINALHGTNRFEVVERQEIETLLSEQDLGASGRAKKSTAPSTGSLRGAEYIVFAAVNEWTPVKSRTGGGAGRGAGALSRIGVEKSTAEVAMSFRVVDASSGKTLFSTLERATSGSWALDLGGISGDGGGSVESQRASPIGYAVQSCMNKGVYKLSMWLKDRPWSGAVARVEGDKVYLNAGSNNGLKVGIELTALARGQEIRDPLTGESLGEEVTEVGTLRIVEVQERLSIARVIEGCKGLKIGDRVRLRSTPVAVQATAMP